MALSPDLSRRLASIRDDRTAGATELLWSAIEILRDAIDRGETVPAAAGLSAAQPSMASLWNAALSAVASEDVPGLFDTFVKRLERSPAAMRLSGAEAFPEQRSRGWRVVTLSASRGVRICLDMLRSRGPVYVSCAESRPALEGRRLAESLAEAGFSVTCLTDAAIGGAAGGADAVLLGADAVGPYHFVNKVGSHMLTAAATSFGTPVYVCASRDKFTMPSLWPCLSFSEGAPAEVWADPPPTVHVLNPYFEQVPLTLATGVISDIGLLTAEMAPQVCDSLDEPHLRAALARVQRHLGPPVSL